MGELRERVKEKAAIFSKYFFFAFLFFSILEQVAAKANFATKCLLSNC